ncbi:MAG: 3-oxoacyl-ACP reductase FabG [Chloroflexi bacterium]|nr:3-oxoacyl-ACP reductase FabG [Chloroflexota bacterium]
MERLAGKVALVTGSARGIGKVIAMTFAGEGADVVVNDIRASEAEKTAQEIKQLGHKAIAITADVSNKEQVKNMMQSAMQQLGKLDILVNNAGTPGRATLLDMSEEVWDRVVDVNLKGVFLCTQAIAPHMIERKYGKILNISSIEGMGGSAKSSSNYTAAKAGVIQMTKTHARELGAYGINVNCVCPGGIITEGTFNGRSPEAVEKHKANVVEHACLARLGDAREIASLVLFLVSDESSYVTAQNIACDGGRFDRM